LMIMVESRLLKSDEDTGLFPYKGKFQGAKLTRSARCVHSVPLYLYYG
jgi:hypothetical protein